MPWLRPKGCCARSAPKTKRSFVHSSPSPARRRSRSSRPSRRSTAMQLSMPQSTRFSTASPAGCKAGRPAGGHDPFGERGATLGMSLLASPFVLNPRHGGIVERLEEYLCRHAHRGDLELVTAGKHLGPGGAPFRVADVGVADREGDPS